MKTKIIKMPSLVQRFTKNLCIGSSPFIFLPEEIYNNYMSESPHPVVRAIVEHEKIHIERQKEIGYLKWMFLYFFSKSFCLEEEMKATAEEVKIYESNNLQFNFEERISFLSSCWIYNLFHQISSKEAEEALKNLFNNKP